MAELLEHGDVFFLVRPRVSHSLVRDLDDVQRLLLVLRPSDRPYVRSVAIGRKKLPVQTPARQRFWAYVDEVGEPEEVIGRYGAGYYGTRTRGVRFQPSARLVAQGGYAIAGHGPHTHFVYALDGENFRTPLQRELRIEPLASYVVAVMNPLRSRAGADPDAVFPPELQSRFEGRRFTPLDPPSFLDHIGAQLVLIGTGMRVRRALGIELPRRDRTRPDIVAPLREPEPLPLFDLPAQ